MVRLAIPALTLLLTACASEVVLREPLGEVPDVRGRWEGAWGGTPVSLVVVSQAEAASDGSITLGRWTLAGQPLPVIEGVFTFAVDGAPVSVNVRGRFGDLGGHLALVIDVLTPDRDRLVLDRVRDDRLAGRGTSRLPWHPRGVVSLVRVSPDAANR